MASSSASPAQDLARGELRVTQLEGGLFVSKVTGHFGAELLPAYLMAFRTALGRGPVTGFLDWYEMVAYDSVCRTTLTDWVRTHRAHIRGCHILVHSRLVAMGVSTASMLLGGGLLTAYTQRDEFAAACRGAGAP